ncbi:MAG TPA: DUF58 domain-containing protein [Candidatus Sulfomarinibacteraceae bacterium]|nr:DUF58 domain-containing protein [Candidatus Sulfomarinibacteraceae bacterium]
MTPYSKRTLRLRSRLPLLWVAIALFAALFLPDRIWTTFLVGLGGLLLIAYLWANQLLHGLHGQRSLRFGWVAVGDRLGESFVLSNDAYVPAFWVQIVDFSTVPDYRPAVVRSVGATGIERWRQDAVCRRRGQYHLGPWELRSADPFGLFSVTIQYAQTEELIIHPPIHSELPIPLPAGQSSGRSRSRERSWQATVNAAAVRDYVPGDPQRWIHWRTSARHGKLYVRQFDLDAAGDVWLVLDLEAASQVGDGVESTEEHAVLLAAALIGRARHENRSLGLATYGQQPAVIPPGQGAGQEWRLLRALALVSASGETGLHVALEDLSRVARRGSAAVIITSTSRVNWLPALVQLAQGGVQANVILLERTSFGASQSNLGLQDAVRQLGFNCHVIRKGDVDLPPETGEQRGYWKFRTLATGKVVVLEQPQ